MKYILSTKDKNFQINFKKVLNSKRQQSEINRSVVLKIIKDVQKNGDQSLIKYSKKFDKISLNLVFWFVLRCPTFRKIFKG